MYKSPNSYMPEYKAYRQTYKAIGRLIYKSPNSYIYRRYI